MVVAILGFGPCMAPIEKARNILSRISMRRLSAAEVYTTEDPDTSNPGGYYHRWVILKHRVFFGLIPWETTVYFERTAFDQTDQDEVYQFVEYKLREARSVMGPP